jgi:hypothetical protein
MNCQFTCEVQPGFYRCQECGAVGIKDMLIECGSAPDYDARQVPLFGKRGEILAPKQVIKDDWKDGPGTRVRNLLRALGFPSCGACTGLARDMNKNGVDWCRENESVLVEQMLQNTERHPKLSDRVKTLARSGTAREALTYLVHRSIKGGMVYNVMLVTAKTIRRGRLVKT